MSGVVKIPPAEFRALAARPPEEIEFYGYDNPLLRGTFWRRLVVMDKLMRRHVPDWSCCLDLGTGSGAFLPTLARRFDQVIAVDNETADAENLIAARSLTNVTLRQGDVFAQPFRRRQFKAIAAADVLEHFPDTVPIASLLVDWLDDDGILVTSLPTENWIYVLLRKVFRVEKPADHYFAAAEVEAELARAGLERAQSRSVPSRLLPLFLVTAWRRRPASRP